MTSKPWSPHGIVFPGKKHPDVPVERLEMTPHSDLSPYIQCYWSVSWDLPEGEAIPTLVVPSGSFNFVFEPAFPWPPMKSRLAGIRQTSFEFELQGKGRMSGVRFTPGGFSVFYEGAVSALVDAGLELSTVVPQFDQSLTHEIFATTTLEELAQVLDPVFLKLKPADVPEDFRLLEQFFTLIADKSGPLSVNEVCQDLETNERQLQRLFERRVGVSPKSILRARRFQAVADLLMDGGQIDWAQFALEMGYYDQSHLLNDFRSLTGWNPRDLKDTQEPSYLSKIARDNSANRFR